MTAVSEVTGFPEILDGRVKTLHPRIHGGILADRSQAGAPRRARASTASSGSTSWSSTSIRSARTVADPSASPAEIVEMIDIGGPSMVRAAAKNFAGVAVVVDPADYPRGARRAARTRGGVGLARDPPRAWRAKAFAHTAAYDAAIAAWFARADARGRRLPARCSRSTSSASSCRATARTRTSRPPSIASLGGPGVLGGMTPAPGQGAVLEQPARRRRGAQAGGAVRRAGGGDRQAQQPVRRRPRRRPGGGLPARPRLPTRSRPSARSWRVNRPLDERARRGDGRPLRRGAGRSRASTRRRSSGSRRKKNLRLLVCPPYALERGRDRAARGRRRLPRADARRPRRRSRRPGPVRRRRQPTAAERRALEFAWTVCRYVKSNAIVIANARPDGGHRRRPDEPRRLLPAGDRRRRARRSPGRSPPPTPSSRSATGSTCSPTPASTAVVQPGGSKRDDEVVAAADEHGLAMLFTGTRHFRH